MPFIPLLNTDHLLTGDMSEGYPWEFEPRPEILESLVTLPKDERRNITSQAGAWNLYSGVRGLTRIGRVSKENPPVGIRAIVVDYDRPIPDDEVLKAIRTKLGRSPELQPNYLERSLSGNVRLLWIFEREVLVADETFCTNLIKSFLKRFKAEGLLHGYDEKSATPTQIWTNGVSWTLLKEDPIPWETVFGITCTVSASTDRGDAEIPYEVLHEEVEKKWPGRWKGPFALDNLGVRFWDPKADNPAGCRVKPDGMQCFTGHTGFMKWEQILGATWCDSQRALNLGRAAGDLYFDGKVYWQKKGERWYPVAREDVMLALKVKEISPRPRKGSVSSDMDRVLRYIQEVNRVDGAAPIVNRKPGITNLDGQRILNISTVRALQPSLVTPITVEMIPCIWDVLNGMYDDTPLGPLDYWLAWLQRYYTAVLEYKPLMGQATFICGPKNCGKTLLTYRIVKPLVGDRAANPYEYFTGATSFNAELFESPLLMMNDEESISDIRTRLRFLARLKSFVVNPSHTYHRKFSTPISVEWTGRLVATLNDDPDSVGLLPEINSNTQDKIMFFRAKERPGRWADNHILEARIAEELPLFARYLLDWKPPEELLVGGRMGVASYFDKTIKELSLQQNAHYRMVEVLKIWFDQGLHWLEPNSNAKWCGDPTRFFVELSGIETMAAAMRDQNPAKCAQALTTLARISGSGITRVEGEERLFEIDKATVLKKDNPAVIPEEV